MIYVNRNLSVKKSGDTYSSTMNDTLTLYRGDGDVEIHFSLQQTLYMFDNNGVKSNNPAFTQLVIKKPDGTPVFSEITEVQEGNLIVVTVTKDMLDEIEEVGEFSFQLRLFDAEQNSRISIPPVIRGIRIKEPLAIEGGVIE